jgi:hypothetical protein
MKRAVSGHVRKSCVFKLDDAYEDSWSEIKFGLPL